MTHNGSDWKWCGHAHHFVGADSCAHHLSTFVNDGRFLVSTVGAYRPGGPKAEMERLGAGPDSFYETFVFRTDPTDLDDGCPRVADWGEIDSTRYATPGEANAGHMEFCRQYAEARPYVPSDRYGTPDPIQ